MGESVKRFCPKCRKTIADTNFYTYKNGGKAEFCKPCMTMHINNWDPETYEWILKEFDVPYIPSEWNRIRDAAVAKDPKKITGMSVIGKYLSKMKLRQWNKYGYADTESILKQQEEDYEKLGTPKEQLEQKIVNMKSAYENGEITEAQYSTYVEMMRSELDGPPITRADNTPPAPTPQVMYGSAVVENSPFEQVEIIDVGKDLPEEDKIYLAMKWGTLYTAADWVAMEQLYKDFLNSFDVQGAARLDTVKFICKTSLKMNQALDAGDVDTYQKLARVYDQQMKAGKFTEAQRKDDKTSDFSSYGQIVAFCEKEGGFIPRLETNTDRDIADKDLHDMKKWVKDLVEEDPAIFKQIEQYIKKREIAESHDKDMAEALANGEEAYTLTDEDMADYSDSLFQQREEDEDL